MRKLYLYVVSFATLLMLIFSTVNVVRAAINLALPPVPPPSPSYPEPLSPAVAAENVRAEQSARRDAIMQLINAATLLVIAAPLYLYHWRLAQHTEGNP